AYPTRPVRLVVGAPAGGGFDIVARLIGQWLSERLGQPVVIENPPGASSNIPTQTGGRGPAGGDTLPPAPAANAINTTLYEKLSFNLSRDIAPVTGITRVPDPMVANLSVPSRTIPEVHRLCQGQSRQAHHGVGWCRNPLPSGGRAVQDDDRRRHAACALSRHRPFTDGLARWTSAGDVHLHALGDRIHQGWQAACARSNHRGALGRGAGHPDRR